MARSYKKNPIFGNADRSDKEGKRKANRALRKGVKTALVTEREIPLLREVSNAWTMPKDGKNYWTDATKADLRK
jgi:hypothetical protein